MFYSPIIRFKPVIQYKHKMENFFQEAAKMEKNKENKSKTKLNDELLDPFVRGKPVPLYQGLRALRYTSGREG